MTLLEIEFENIIREYGGIITKICYSFAYDDDEFKDLLNIYLFYQTKDINVYTSTITEITKKASMNWKIHKIGVLAGLPLSFVGIFIMALSLNTYEYILYGMAVGGVLGLIIGVIQFLKFRSNYKLLVKAI